MPRAGEHGLGEAREKGAQVWNYGLGLKQRQMKSKIYQRKIWIMKLMFIGLMDDG